MEIEFNLKLNLIIEIVFLFFEILKFKWILFQILFLNVAF